ncbi:Hypothetical protein LUCI_0341 [Lucifera butyrica]|uniref:HTH araC/xylS-type domain-containing protein n=1 Tax=Lucifera butyrica TaxID=1351585 RepID=A0A498R116_9FIRM|nr:AraC family transcriptional regulator [Lucifera butyrica]VBB05134.1 Hypothetical protein LUCI_0341 [Lucifera butyrica]
MEQINLPYLESICFEETLHKHVHDSGHLILPLQGTLNLQTDNQLIIVDSQHILFLPPVLEHSYFSKERNKFLVFFIPSYISYSCSNEVKFLDFNAQWYALRFLMLSECQNKKTNTTAIKQLLYYSFHLIQQSQEPPSLRYLRENYHSHISLKTLAQLEHYQVNYYSQWFEKKVGTNVQTFIHKLRLEEAKRLLRETNFTILDIAQQVGYEYQASLTRLFKQYEGTTPRVYRDNFKK